MQIRLTEVEEDTGRDTVFRGPGTAAQGLQDHKLLSWVYEDVGKAARTLEMGLQVIPRKPGDPQNDLQWTLLDYGMTRLREIMKGAIHRAIGGYEVAADLSYVAVPGLLSMEEQKKLDKASSTRDKAKPVGRAPASSSNKGAVSSSRGPAKQGPARKYCSNCKTNVHNTVDCPAQAKGKGPATPKS